MNKREREVLRKIYGHLGMMSTLQPSNPADIRAISVNLRACTRMANSLRKAVEHLGHGEFEQSEEYISDAQKALDRRDAEFARDASA